MINFILPQIGDVNLNYTKSNGAIIKWSITIRGLDYNDRITDTVISKEAAIRILEENKHREEYIENKDLKRLLDSF